MKQEEDLQIGKKKGKHQQMFLCLYFPKLISFGGCDGTSEMY